MTARAEVRRHIDIAGRVALLENDVDTYEKDLTSIRKSINGLLIAITTACILLAINAAILGSKG